MYCETVLTSDERILSSQQQKVIHCQWENDIMLGRPKYRVTECLGNLDQ